MKRFGVTRQESRFGVTYRIRTLAEFNNHGMNNTERITLWIDETCSKQELATIMKASLEKAVQK